VPKKLDLDPVLDRPKGVPGASKTGSNEPQRLFARSRNKLSGGYTSHDFVTVKAWGVITTALQPPPLYIGYSWQSPR